MMGTPGIEMPVYFHHVLSGPVGRGRAGGRRECGRCLSVHKRARGEKSVVTDFLFDTNGLWRPFLNELVID
jgi:hypothetical protein